jgi:hypothetical protein
MNHALNLFEEGLDIILATAELQQKQECWDQLKDCTGYFAFDYNCVKFF